MKKFHHKKLELNSETFRQIDTDEVSGAMVGGAAGGKGWPWSWNPPCP